ncbi:MAG: hypothetical protein ABIH99_05675 [Candidatus Micrarchaeota archaeon]
MASPVYSALNKAWKSTCRILFEEEIGELSEYEEWLNEYLPAVGKRKSRVSGKEVRFSVDDYPQSANFISADEIKDTSIKAEALSVNEIKDMDSLLEAISDKWEYAGNKALGNSSFVELSDSVQDSQYVMNSVDIQQASYIFACHSVKSNSRYLFGCGRGIGGEFLLRCVGTSSLKRCFETSGAGDCSDVYFSHHCYNSSNMMFSFNQRANSYCIGNLKLPKEKYLALKTKLLGEIKEELKRSKKFPSILEFVPNTKPNDIDLHVSPPAEGQLKPIDKAFSSTCKIILKKELNDITKYENWLSKHIISLKEIASPFGAATFVSRGARESRFYTRIPEKRAISYPEGMELGKIVHLNEDEITSLEKITSALPKIGYFTMASRGGIAINLVKSPRTFNAANVYKGYAIASTHTPCEYVAISSAIASSKYLFGTHGLLNSQFCINCYDSLNLMRCFEVDSSTKCSDSLFCFNCEALSEALFCFNTKAKRYAIGNAQLAPEKYSRIKASLLEQIGSELEKKKELKWDIFNIGRSEKD